MLSESQESNLVSGGDCPDHWHSSDRILSRDNSLQLQELAKGVEVSSDHAVLSTQDYILADTSLSNITVTLPRAGKGREVEVMKNATANFLKIITVAPDKILGDSEVRVYNYGTSLRFKAVSTGWIFI